MQLASRTKRPWRSADLRNDSKRKSQVLVIGFDPATSATVSRHVEAMAFEPLVCAEPFDALATLIEDPGAFMACVMDATAFVSETAFHRYVRLFAFEGQTIGIILGNTSPEAADRHGFDGIDGIDCAVRNACDASQLRRGMAAVLSRRGHGYAAPDRKARKLIGNRQTLRHPGATTPVPA